MVRINTKSEILKKFRKSRHPEATPNTYKHEITDNMHHGNHTKYICIVKDDVLLHCFDQVIESENFKKIMTLHNYSETHDDPHCISSHGEGVKMDLFQAEVCAILSYNHDGTINVIQEYFNDTIKKLKKEVKNENDMVIDKSIEFEIEPNNYDKQIKRLAPEITDEINIAKVQKNLKKYNDGKPFGLIMAYKISDDFKEKKFSLTEFEKDIGRRYAYLKNNKYYVTEYQHIIEGNTIEPVQRELFLPEDDNKYVSELFKFKAYDGGDGWLYFKFPLTDQKYFRCKKEPDKVAAERKQAKKDNKGTGKKSKIYFTLSSRTYDLPPTNCLVCDCRLGNVENNGQGKERQKGIMLYINNTEVNKEPIKNCGESIIDNKFSSTGGSYFKDLRVEVKTTKSYIQPTPQKIESTMSKMLKDIFEIIFRFIDDMDYEHIQKKFIDEELIWSTIKRKELNKKDRSGFLYWLKDTVTRPKFNKLGNSKYDFNENEKALNNNYPTRHYPYGVKVMRTIPVKDRFLAERLLFAKLQEFRIGESEWFINDKRFEEQIQRSFDEVAKATEAGNGEIN